MFDSPAPLIDANLEPVWRNRDAYESFLRKDINPDVASTFGYNESFTTGYLLSSRVVGPEWVGYARQTQAYEHAPFGFIPPDFTGGKISKITGWDSYNDARLREARVFLGDALGRDVLTTRFTPKVRVPLEGSEGISKKQTEIDLDRTIDSKEQDMNCL